MAFVSAIVGNIFLNSNKTSRETNPFLDPLPIFNCPIFYARTLNSVFDDGHEDPGRVSFKPKSLFTAEGLTAPVYGATHEPLLINPENISNVLIDRPYTIQELKDQAVYGNCGGCTAGGSPNSDDGDASMNDPKNPTKSWTPESVTVQNND